MSKLFQLRRSSIKTLVLITLYLISWKKKRVVHEKEQNAILTLVQVQNIKT